MGVAALAATFIVWSVALNPLIKRKLKLSLFLLIGYVLLHVVFAVRPELGGAAATDAASPIRPVERLALTAAVINLLVVGLINPLRSDRIRDRFPAIVRVAFHISGQGFARLRAMPWPRGNRFTITVEPPSEIPAPRRATEADAGPSTEPRAPDVAETTAVDEAAPPAPARSGSG